MKDLGTQKTMIASDAMVATLAATGSSTAAHDRGEAIGRYVILRRLGEGGMGVVYAAYDPELDRRVALKLLKSDSGLDTIWLLREAQAMARVNHPNVVTVHDVGEHEGQVMWRWNTSPARPSAIGNTKRPGGRSSRSTARPGQVLRPPMPADSSIETSNLKMPW